jgi:aerobic-type carbon monoxide dehydrogenase small subunit (CoxS/CutS family)
VIDEQSVAIMDVKLSINGLSQQLDVDADMPLLWALREQLGLTGTKYGCGIAQCGACTVHLDGKPIRSCVTPVAAGIGKKVTTIEGLGSQEKPHPVQVAWAEIGVPQCGYCQSGQIMSAAALLAAMPDPDRRRHRRRHGRKPLPLRHLPPASAKAFIRPPP